jgi:hypothetical protein
MMSAASIPYRTFLVGKSLEGFRVTELVKYKYVK